MRTWVPVVLLLAVVAGCKPAPPPAPEVEVSVAPATYATLDAAVKSYKGDVVLMDFWATWCPPCVATFPDFVELHRKYAARGLRCVSVSLDKPADDMAVVGFLREQRAGFRNFHWGTYGDEAREFQTHFRFRNTVPHKVAFDRGGNLVWDSSTQYLSDRGLDELVRRLLDGR